MTVQLADFVVTYSLQLNNRCLRYLADCDVHGGAVIGMEMDTIRPEVSVFAESLLTRDSRRLHSMWDLWRSAVGEDADLRAHISNIATTAHLLTSGPAQKRLALRLASIAAEEEQAQAMVKVMRRLPVSTALTWDGLNELFLADSAYWRRRHLFPAADGEQLVLRIVRNYRRGFRAKAIYVGLPPAEQGRWLNDNAAEWLQYAQHAVHQLELLRPKLSEKGKGQLWYLEKLTDTLRTRVGLFRLRAQVKGVKSDKIARKTTRRFVAGQIVKMDRRLDRLLESSYATKPKRVARVIANAVAGNALEHVALLAVPRPRPAAMPYPGRLEQEHKNAGS